MQQSIFSYQKKLMNKKTNRPAEKKICLALPVMVWIVGLVLAGSEGELMPYLNVAGAVVFFGASVWLGRILPCLESDAKIKKSLRKKIRYSVSSLTKVDYCFANKIMAAPKTPIIWGCSETRTSFSKAPASICTIHEIFAPRRKIQRALGFSRARLTTLK